MSDCLLGTPICILHQHHVNAKSYKRITHKKVIFSCQICFSSFCFLFYWAAVTQTVKNLPAMQETWVWSLGWADPLEKGMASHSRTLVWKIPWTEEPGGLQSMGSHRAGPWTTNTFTFSPFSHHLRWTSSRATCFFPLLHSLTSSTSKLVFTS